MAITLDLPPHIEAPLLQRAAATGQDIHHTALAFLSLGLSFNDNDFLAALEGIQSGLDDFA